MNLDDPKVMESLRHGFRYLNRFMLAMWRLGLGQWMSVWPAVFGAFMVITHRGRKTGIKHKTPVNFAEVEGEIYCVAGFGQISDWFRNMKADPAVEIWLPGGEWWQAEAEEVTDPQIRQQVMRKVILNSGFAARIFGVNAQSMPDEELTALTSSYLLIRMRRSAPQTGLGGPGELAWVWPVATMILAILLMGRKKRCTCGKRGAIAGKRCCK